MRNFDKMVQEKMKLYEYALPQSAPGVPRAPAAPTAATTPAAPAAPTAGAPAAAAKPATPTTPAQASQLVVDVKNLPDILGQIQKNPELQKALSDFITQQKPTTPTTPATPTPTGV